MIIKKKRYRQILGDEQRIDSEGNGALLSGDQNSAQEAQKVDDGEINLFDLDNIDFKQRQERRRGDRRRGFRRIDDRNLISRAKEEAFSIKDAARKEGYQVGVQEVHSEFDELKESIKAFFDSPQQVYDEIAPDILEISLDIAKKILKKEVTDNQDIILDNIKDILKGLSKEESKITLRVHPSQADLLRQEVPEIAVSLGLEVKLYVVADETLMPGGCVLTTSNGVIDASIESQLAIISEVLKEI